MQDLISWFRNWTNGGNTLYFSLFNVFELIGAENTMPALFLFNLYFHFALLLKAHDLFFLLLAHFSLFFLAGFAFVYVWP
jgi:hypothetical protein